MQKRAGLARAIALDPDILFFDEPSAGLDPITSRLLDDLILSLRDSLGATVVIVSHELASIFAIGDDCVFLDTELRTISARGNPRRLLEAPPNENIRRFLTRGASMAGPEPRAMSRGRRANPVDDRRVRPRRARARCSRRRRVGIGAVVPATP